MQVAANERYEGEVIMMSGDLVVGGQAVREVYRVYDVCEHPVEDTDAHHGAAGARRTAR